MFVRQSSLRNHRTTRLYTAIGGEKIVSEPEDYIRDQIMEYFYQMYVDRSGTFRGRERGDKAVQEIAKQLKIDRTVISRNLEYLVKSKHIEHITKYEPSPHDTNIKLEKHSYEISIEGINKIEGKSKYMSNQYSGINISNVGGVVVLGDENIVSQNYQELTPLLSELSEAIRNEEIPDTDKLNLIADIETIRQQIKKPTPNKGILSSAWESIRNIDTNKGLQSAGKIVELIEKISKFFA